MVDVRHGGVDVALAVLQAEAHVAGEELREFQFGKAPYGGDGLLKRAIPNVLEQDAPAKEEGVAAKEGTANAVVVFRAVCTFRTVVACGALVNQKCQVTLAMPIGFHYRYSEGTHTNYVAT